MRFRQALANMLGHAHPERLFYGAAFQLRAQIVHGRDIELLVNTQDTLGVETGIGAYARESGAGLGLQFFKFSQAAGEDDSRSDRTMPDVMPSSR